MPTLLFLSPNLPPYKEWCTFWMRLIITKGPQNYQVLVKFTNFRGINPRQASCTLHPSLRKIVMGIMRTREWGCQRRSFMLPKELFIYHWTRLFINWKDVLSSLVSHSMLRHYMHAHTMYVISKADLIKYFFSRLVRNGWLVKWVVILEQHHLIYMP